MNKTNIYIQGIGSISAQNFSANKNEYNFIEISNQYFSCVEPDYKEYITPMQLRRMGKVVKYGIATSMLALKDAQIKKPDMITVGTAYGCLADTEIFLTKIIENKETLLTPTSFIQSTHNTVSGQIALLLSCHSHNFTFVQKGFSFESSLEETTIWLHENPTHQVLCGGIDEYTQHSLQIISRFGTYKKPNEPYQTESAGTTAGEGAHFFVLSTEIKQNSYAEIIDLHLCYQENIELELKIFLEKNQLSTHDIDCCLIGTNGDIRYDAKILNNCISLLNSQFIEFKKWSGEYPTSNAFALSLASSILKNKKIPNHLIKKDIGKKSDKLEYILIYNHYKNKNHSFILLKGI